ncbi:uncharacterized protein LOC114352238 [Ostrinia furnacalis]|uniref:uncharacterized protein LOC114352238 n=1 Tax=Ostrinia furnacalis TaxID=93504 RepID=UPI0010399A8C|nr:uncharacterized protein LOC114352238 [Ostrinia furnacalis]
MDNNIYAICFCKAKLPYIAALFINYNITFADISLPPTVVDNQISDTTVHSNEDFVTKDWGDYTPQSLRTPVSQALRSNDETVVKNTKTTENIMKPIEKQARTRQAWISLEQLHKKKIEAIDLQKQLAVEEMERSKVLHDLDIQIKKQILRQEKIKTNILLIKRRRLLAHKKSTIL